jgi:hypothetical protein
MSDEDEKKYQIPPGTYTRETLPPLSPGAQEIYDRVKAKSKEPDPERDRLYARAKAAYEKSVSLVAFMDVIFGPPRGRGSKRP